jgi:hypothetical protein
MDVFSVTSSKWSVATVSWDLAMVVPWFSAGGQWGFCPTEVIGQYLEIVLIVRIGKKVEARDAATCSTMCRTALHNEELSGIKSIVPISETLFHICTNANSPYWSPLMVLFLFLCFRWGNIRN